MINSNTYILPPEHLRAFQRMEIRKNIEGQLSEIRTILHNSPLQDELTNHIRKWYEDFAHFVRSPASLDQTEKGFIALLQQMLIDPITQTPLDNEAHLGSDGYTYANYSLCLYLSTANPENQNRSPLKPELEEPFTTTPHPIARFLVDWLISRRDYPQSVEFERVQRAFIALQDSGRIPLVPTTQNQRIRALMQAQLQRRAKEKSRIQTPINQHIQSQLRARTQSQNLLNEFNVLINRQLEVINESVNQVFDAIEEQAQQVTDRQLNRINTIEQRDQAEVRRLSQEIEGLNTQIEELQRQNQELEASLCQLEKSISDVERANIQLQISINETRQVIMERNSGAMSQLLGGLAIIGLCAVTTWALGGAGVVTPLSKGAQVNFIYPI